MNELNYINTTRGIVTPNIDELANAGVRWHSCAGSRLKVLTFLFCQAAQLLRQPNLLTHTQCLAHRPLHP